jgi:hypothetical protein
VRATQGRREFAAELLPLRALRPNKDLAARGSRWRCELRVELIISRLVRELQSGGAWPGV